MDRRCRKSWGGNVSLYFAEPEYARDVSKERQKGGWRNYANRMAITDDSLFPQARTFADGIDFIRRNNGYDNWFLQIETFDPHEPFTSPKGFESRWFDPDKPFIPDWPPYSRVSEDKETIENMRKKYYALMEYCDFCLGQVLDEMDEKDMWKDTMLIVNTDHGFFLGEHDWWGKGNMPDFEELTHTPLFIWDPRSGKKGERRQTLVQTIDLAPTVLEFFGQEIPEDMEGKPLKDTIERDVQVRQYGLFGYHGGPVNITDGRWVYMRRVENEAAAANEYTLMPTHMDSRFAPEELKEISLAEPFSFTKGVRPLKIPATGTARFDKKITENLLYDLQQDPKQERPVRNQEKEEELKAAMKELFLENQAPEELYIRYGL